MSEDEALTEILNRVIALYHELREFRAEVNASFDRIEAIFDRREASRSGIARPDGKSDVKTRDLDGLRLAYQELEKRVRVLERRAGITDTV